MNAMNATRKSWREIKNKNSREDIQEYFQRMVQKAEVWKKIQMIGQRAEQKIRGGDYEGAVQDYTKCLKYQPINARILSKRAALFVKQGKLSRALLDLNQVVFIEYLNGGSYQQRAELHLSMKNYDLAIEDLLKAKELLPRQGFLYFNLGMAYFQLENYFQAENHVNRAIQLQPWKSQYFIGRAMVKQAEGNYEAALKDLEKGIIMNPREQKGYFMREKIYIKQNNLENAVQNYIQFLNYNENHIPVLLKLSSCQLKLTQKQNARQTFNKFIKIFNKKLMKEQFNIHEEVIEYTQTSILQYKAYNKKIGEFYNKAQWRQRSDITCYLFKLEQYVDKIFIQELVQMNKIENDEKMKTNLGYIEKQIQIIEEWLQNMYCQEQQEVCMSNIKINTFPEQISQQCSEKVDESLQKLETKTISISKEQPPEKVQAVTPSYNCTSSDCLIF